MKFIYKESRLIFGHFVFGVYQKPKRIEFSIISDWSEKPFLIEISLLMWAVSVEVYKNRKDYY